MNDVAYSIAVFPFLKTYAAVKLGPHMFRSTEDISGLPPEQARSVAEIADMLFLKDDLRISTATYAILPSVDVNSRNVDVGPLIRVQAVVAYLYNSPHELFGTPFLSSEHASMAILSPGKVSVILVRPDFNVKPAEDRASLGPDQRGQIPGYHGLYNFRHYFQVALGSRLYGPMPHLTLNLSQDLCADVGRIGVDRPYRLLLRLLDKPDTPTSSRIFTAVQWYVTANSAANDDGMALVDLSIAFESLLGLPQSEKTERFVDAISLLLGRLPRLGIWAKQFYDARSVLVHEGRSKSLDYFVSDSGKGTERRIYQPLISYGREIFRLCLATLLVGAELSEKAGLEDKFVTNQERFEQICIILGDSKIEPNERFARVHHLVNAIDRYRSLGETGLKLETMIGACRLAADKLLACDTTLPQDISQHLASLVAAKRTSDHLEELKTLADLDEILPENGIQGEGMEMTTTRVMLKAVWQYVSMHYYWLLRNQT